MEKSTGVPSSRGAIDRRLPSHSDGWTALRQGYILWMRRISAASFSICHGHGRVASRRHADGPRHSSAAGVSHDAANQEPAAVLTDSTDRTDSTNKLSSAELCAVKVKAAVELHH